MGRSSTDFSLSKALHTFTSIVSIRPIIVLFLLYASNLQAMTIEDLDVKSVAVIGGGPGGLASLRELLAVGISNVTVFERKADIGGLWYADLGTADLSKAIDAPVQVPATIDPPISPDDIPQDVLNNDDDHNDSVTVEKDCDKEKCIERWEAGGVYSYLYTNVPEDLMRFTYTDPYPPPKDASLAPFREGEEVQQHLKEYFSRDEYRRHIRCNTRVEQVFKRDNKWVVISVEKEIGSNKELWRRETFDAVILASGHFHVPKFPPYPHLKQFNSKFPNVLDHSLNYRDYRKFLGKKVLVVGHGISGTDYLRDLSSFVAGEITISRRSDNWYYPWLKRVSHSTGIRHKTAVSDLDPDTGEVIFEDGTREKFDYILFATGYFYHFPYLDERLIRSTTNRVKDLYLHTFSIQDSTLIYVGLPSIAPKFISLEAQAAAAAGVLSGKTHLPSKEEEIIWEQKEAAKKDERHFHVISLEEMRQHFDDLYELSDKNVHPVNPIDTIPDYEEQIVKGWDRSEAIFYERRKYYQRVRQELEKQQKKEEI